VEPSGLHQPLGRLDVECAAFRKSDSQNYRTYMNRRLYVVISVLSRRSAPMTGKTKAREFCYTVHMNTPRQDNKKQIADQEFVLVHDKQELDVLRGKTAQYENLTFAFTPEYVDTLKNMLDEKNAYQLLVRDADGNFSAYIAAAEKDFKPNYLCIVELFVDPEKQGTGLGKVLMKKVIDEARRRKLQGVITQTEFENIPAQHLYKCMGLRMVHNHDWKNGITLELKFSE